MRSVQLLLTDGQAELVAAALRDAEEALQLEQETGVIPGTTSEEVSRRERLAEDIAAVGRLALLFQDASENPAKYPPAPKMAASIRKFRKQVQGQAQPQSLRKRRASRHQRRRAERHFFRRNRDLIDGVNAAREAYEREAEEHARNIAEIEERVKDQSKFTVTDGFGNVVMAGVPAEFIITERDTSLQEEFFSKPKLYVPASAEQPAKIVEVSE